MPNPAIFSLGLKITPRYEANNHRNIAAYVNLRLPI